VDAEERNSLNKINKKEPLAQEVYNFPEIPIEHSSGEGDGFQRIDFGDNGEASSGNLEGNGDYLEQIKKGAYVEGFAQGEKAGMEAGGKRLEPVLNNFREALSELGKVRKEIYLNAEKDIIELAFAIARKIVCNEVTTNKEAVINVIKEALKKVVDHEGIKIKINPSDLQLIKNAKLHISNLFDNIESFTLEEDETITNGGCVIETKAGDIDARIDKQLEVLEEAFRAKLQESGLGDQKA
jgi:flagellar assembly protein FliH